MLRITSLLLSLSLALGVATVEQTISDPEWTAFKAKYKKSYKDADDEQVHPAQTRTLGDGWWRPAVARAPTLAEVR